MWKPIYDPGPWSQYLKREENKGLPLMEIKQKYLKEQLEFEDFKGTVNSTLSPSLASSAASAVGSKPNPTPEPPSPEPPSIYPLKLYVEYDRVDAYGTTSKTVIEYIKYVGAGDEAWNGKPVYFNSTNVVDTFLFDYDPNGVFGNYIRYNIEGNRWEIVGCGLDRSDECTVNILLFGTPIPDPESPLEWGNLIGNWDWLGLSLDVGGCYTSTYVGPGNPKTNKVTIIDANTYTEDPGTATYGTSYSYQENGQYVLPEGVYNANVSLDCGEEPQPCNSLFNIIELWGTSGILPTSVRELNISDEGELVNGRRYWDLFIGGKGSTPSKIYTVRWNGNNWEIALVEGSDPEIVISTNTNRTGDVPYDCSNITGDAPMTWTGNAPYGNGFTTEGTGGILDVSIIKCTSSGLGIIGTLKVVGELSGTLFNDKKQWIASPDTNVRWNDSLGTSGAWQLTYNGVVSVNTNHDGSVPYGESVLDVNVYDMGNGTDYYRVDIDGRDR